MTLFLLAELGLALLSLMELNRLQRDARIHVLLFVSAAIGALTPLIANAAQAVAAPVVLIFVGAVAAALAQAGLWAVVYIATGLPLDAFAGRPPSFLAVSGHWKTGFVKGAIYGGMFMAVVLVGASLLEFPAPSTLSRRHVWLAGALGGALAFPFAQTLIGSADGTPPFFGRLDAAYRDRSAYLRGVVVGLGGAYAYQTNLAAADGGAALPRRLRLRRSRLCRRRRRSSITSASFPANAPRCRPGANTRSARRSAAWSPARSAGISTPRNCKSS